MLPKIINNNGTLYVPFRKVKFKQEDKEILDGLKELWMCDTVLKNENEYWFCRKIDEIEFEEITNEQLIEQNNEESRIENEL